MESISIHADQVTVHLHAAGSGKALADLAAAELATRQIVQVDLASAEANNAPRFIKVFADGSVDEQSSDRTDHVAVLDRANKLMWSVESLGDPDDSDSGVAHDHCNELCRNLRLLDHDDWRQPTRAELASLIDDTRHEPAIDTNFFPRVKPRWHWTSTPAAWSSASAWGVHFDDGDVLDLHRSYYGFALAVRRVGQ